MHKMMQKILDSSNFICNINCVRLRFAQPNCKDTEKFRVFCQYTTMELRGETLTLHLAFIIVMELLRI